MRRLTDEYVRFLTWNAQRENPYPTCKKCKGVYDPSSAADWHPDWCFTCETQWVRDQVLRLVKQVGFRAAKRHLRAMHRYFLTSTATRGSKQLRA
jgi:hypothetical protein